MYCIKNILSSTFATGWNLVGVLIFAIIISIITITRNYYIGRIIDGLKYRDVYIYTCITLVSYVFYVLKYLFVHNQVAEAQSTLFDRFMSKFLNIDIKTTEKHNRTILSDLNESLASHSAILNDVYITFIRQSITLFMTICIIIYHLPHLAYIIVGTIIVSIILQKYIMKVLHNQWVKYWESYTRFNKLFQDIMLNIWNVKYNTIELLVNRLIKKEFNIRLNTYKKWMNYKIIAYEAPDFLFFIIILSILFALIKKKDIAVSIRIFLVLQLFRLWKEYHNICLSMTDIYQNMKYVQKICPVWVHEDPKDDKLNKVKDIKSIRFTNVFYSYSKDVPVLRNINFEVKSGETLSLSGSSGSGKSTIINLICRLYDITDPSSKIEMNDVNISTYNVESIRQCISIVPQNIMVFDMSVKENIILDSPYDAEKVKTLMKMVNLTDMNKNANEMSLGQKQRVIIARTLYQDKSIYIFDEYLSAIDKTNADRIHQFVLNFLKKRNKIGIFISHNPEHANTTDKVVKL